MKLCEYYDLTDVKIGKFTVLSEELPEEHGFKSSYGVGRRLEGSFERSGVAIDFIFTEKFDGYDTAKRPLIETDCKVEDD